MAYTPVGWQTGDTITADRLNRMDRGWDVSTTELFSETVTTADDGSGTNVATLAYAPIILSEIPVSLTITFDGVKYECESIFGADGFVYGDIDKTFKDYPFGLYVPSQSSWNIRTETAGTHTVSAMQIGSVQTSADFDKARGYGYVAGSPTELFSETVTTAEDGGSGIYYATLAYSGFINADTITVTYDGTEYECPPIGPGEYGAPHSGSGYDFSEFPFNLLSGDSTELVTQTAGEHTIAVTTAVKSMQVSNDFWDAASYVAQPIVDDAIAAIPVAPLVVRISKTTWDDVNNAIKAGRPVFVWKHNDSSNSSDTYELVTIARYNNWIVETLAINTGSSIAIVNKYQASARDGVLKAVTS